MLVSQKHHLNAMMLIADRFDLEGAPVGFVNPEDVL
jgi:hypothetical protein